MKTTKLLRLLAGIAALLLFAESSRVFGAHELLYAVTKRNNLIAFYADAPGTLLGARAITGLQGSERIRGIDFSPSGVLYGLGSYSRLYTIDANTGAATQVGSPFTPLLDGQAFGMDIGSNGVRVVSDLRQSLLIDRTTGVASPAPAPSYAAGDPHAGQTPAITALAFNAASGTWYAGDSLVNSFSILDPATGKLATIGPSGIDFSSQNGFDFSATSGIMYLASPAASSDPAANLYTVNPVTGAVTLVGLLGNPGDNILIRGLAVAPSLCTITCPSNLTVTNTAGQCGAAVAFAPTTNGTCGTLTCLPPSDFLFPLGTTPVTCSATGGLTCTFKVTVVDAEPPAIACPPAETLYATSPTGASVNYPAPAALDNCPGVVTVCTPATGSTFPIGTNRVNCTAIDTAGNSNVCSFVVVVLSCTLICPGNLTVDNAPGQCGAPVPFAFLATPGCGPVICLPPPDSFFRVGSTMVTCTAATGSNCNFLVTVLDTELPLIICPSNATVDATGPAGAVVNYPLPAATDNCPGASFVCTPPSGTTFPIGTNTVQCMVTDTAGNSASCTFAVSVLSAGGLKKTALNGLIALRATVADKQDEKRLDEAIKHLQESLDLALWLDPTHLEPRHGNRVFQEEKEAVHEVVELLKSRSIPRATLEDLILQIVTADRLLAKVAIADALATAGHPKKIQEANKELLQGDQDILHRKYEPGIDHYREAWKKALEAAK